MNLYSEFIGQDLPVVRENSSVEYAAAGLLAASMNLASRIEKTFAPRSSLEARNREDREEQTLKLKV